MDAPEGHVSEDAQLDGDNGEGDPERAHGVGDKDDGHAYHDDGGNDDALHRVGKNLQELKENKTTSLLFMFPLRPLQCCC